MKSNLSTPTENNSELRQHWVDERAFRAGTAIAKLSLPLCLVALVLNFFYGTIPQIIADLVFLVGSGLSLLFTHLRKPDRCFTWQPLYFSFLIAIIPSVWISGGIYSPWLGLYLSILAVVGPVIQSKLSPLYNISFLICYVIGWYLFDLTYSDRIVSTYAQNFPKHYMLFGHCVVLIAVGYCINVLLKAEKDLSAEIEQKYSELFQTRAHLIKEENANQAKSTFLANISHELRTPLGAVLGYAHLLQDKNLSIEERSQFAEIIEKNGKQLARLVDDLLDLAKIEAGKIELERIEFRIVDVIQDAVNLLEMDLKRKKNKLSVNFKNSIPDWVKTDPFRFKQVLMNILGNAIKFTSNGEINISLHYSSATLPRLSISVRDTGRGIAEHERPRLFKRFSQADPSMTRRYGGTGLGLNFSRKLAKLLGGDLKLTWSELGQGSEFTMIMPVELTSKTSFINYLQTSFESSKPAVGSESSVNLEGVRILVVDDARENRDIAHRFLAPTGAIIDEAVDGGDCVRKAANTHYDIILMDIQMPDIDGIQATHILRERDFKGPIIAVTAHAMKQDRERCLQAGCSEHLAKPIKKNELLNMVKRFSEDLVAKPMMT